MSAKNQVYEIITERIIQQLESGVVPWRKPWKTQGNVPTNFVTKKPYRGINVILLSMTAYTSQYWLTFNQVKQLGGSIKKGQQSEIVIYWNWVEPKSYKAVAGTESEAGEMHQEKVPLLRYYRVFNLEQTTIEVPQCPKNEPLPILDRCEGVISAMPNKPDIKHVGNIACYCPGLDLVKMPKRDSFFSIEKYYSTLFHELGHSTGHLSRLNRKEVATVSRFGGDDYSKEELVAEFTAAFLCGITGIEQETINNSSAYIESWLKALKQDKKLLVCASTQAQKASDYILNKQQE